MNLQGHIACIQGIQTSFSGKTDGMSNQFPERTE